MRVTSGGQQKDSVCRSSFDDLTATRRFLAKLEESTVLRYALAPVCVAVAVLLHISVIGPFLHPTGLFLAGIVAAAWFGGPGPGFLAALLATFALPQLIAMSYPLIAGFFDLPRFVAFGMTGVAVGWGTTFRKRAEAALRRSELELSQARDELEMKVVERTAELRRSEALLAEAQKLSRTGSWAGRADLVKSTYWSAEMFRIMGFPIGDNPPTNEEASKHFTPEAWAGILELFETARRNKAASEGEFPMVLPDGSNRTIRIVGHPVLDAAGDIVEFVGTTIDVTEQREARAALENALAEIKKSEDRLRVIIDTVPVLAWSTLPDGSAEFLNQRWLEYTGLSAEEAQGWGWTVAIHPDDSAKLTETWRAILASEKPGELEARLRRFDGEYRWFLFRAVPLRDELDNIVKWYGTNTDIEDRKQAEKIRTAQARQAGLRADVSAALSKLADSAEILRGCAEAIVRHLDAAFARIWTLNKEKNMLELQASAGMYTHLDGPHSRIQVGELKIGLIAEEKKPHLTNDVVNDPRVSDKAWAQNEGIVSFAGYPLIVQDRVVGVMAMFARQRLSAATVDTLAWVADSIAHAIERKQAEDGLREQARLLDLTHDTVFVRDMKDVITYWNRGAEQLYGWTKEEAVGKVSHQLTQTIFPASLEAINAELLRTGRWEGELVHTKRDGSQAIVASRWSMHQDERGRPIATLETNIDITERKRAEEALNKTQGELAHVTRVTTLGEMTASIAHEVNQPLAAVVNNASACLRWLAANNLEEARHSTALIIADGHRASEIIGRIRAFVEKAPSQKAWLNINETILEVIALARSEVQRNRVSLHTALSDDVPLVFGDRIQLQQVILNLISNAVEAMSGVGEGARELLVGSRKDESQGVLVVVRDSGPGLDPESLNHIFTAFYSTKPQGMGMGLAISRSIIEAHGGRLWATANEGGGAVFRFTLPRDAERAI